MEEKKIDKEENSTESYINGIPRTNFRSTIMFLYFLIIIGAIMYALVKFNPGVLQLDEKTLVLFNQFMNLITVALIPFIFGMLGAVTRIMISGINILHGYYGIVVASGLMSFFSWISIKSGVFVALILPQIKDQTIIDSYKEINTEHDFYSIVLVSILVGMFSSNIYIMINRKVEELTGKDKNNIQIVEDKKEK